MEAGTDAELKNVGGGRFERLFLMCNQDSMIG